MPRGSTTSATLSDIPIAKLHREIAKRQSRTAELRRERDRLMSRLARLDSQIRASGADVGGMNARRGGGGGGGGGGRRKEGNTLSAALASVLKGREMGVSEAADAVIKAGYRTNAANFRTIVNACLIKNKDTFKKVSRGLYTAA